MLFWVLVLPRQYSNGSSSSGPPKRHSNVDSRVRGVRADRRSISLGFGRLPLDVCPSIAVRVYRPACSRLTSRMRPQPVDETVARFVLPSPGGVQYPASENAAQTASFGPLPDDGSLDRGLGHTSKATSEGRSLCLPSACAVCGCCLSQTAKSMIVVETRQRESLLR